MDNYVRYLIKFITVFILVGVVFLFVVTVRNTTSSKLNKKTDSTNIVNHDKTDTTKEDDTLEEETTKDNTTSVANTNSNNNAETNKMEDSKQDSNKEVEFSLNFDIKTLNVGETAKIVVTSSDDNLKVNYKSSDKSVATVTSNGVINALKKGSTYLEVNVNNDTSKIIELVVNNSSVKDNSNTTTTDNSTVELDAIEDEVESSVKNGWYKENGNKYYYKDGTKVTNSYVNYIYLNSKGVAQDKVGSFSATLYGATAWTNQSVNIRKKASQDSSLLGTIPTGGKVKILSSDNSSTKYIKIKYNNITGYVYSNFLLINLPDVIPDMLYEITSASKSTAKAGNTSIPGITGKNLYGFTKKYNSKIGKTTYYAPLLYPTAKKLQRAYNKAKKEGYNLKVYDSYRPHDITVSLNKNFRKLYNSNSKVKNAIDYDKDGDYWGPSWFLAGSVSAHNKGVALDIGITNSKNQELKAQTDYDTLDTTSIVKYNNTVANKLRSIMLSQGFSPLESEWWHFQDNSYYNTSPVVSFHLK